MKDLLKRGLDSTSTTIPSEMEVNELISRNREELVVFEEMDAKREPSKYKDVLVTEDELPSWVIQTVENNRSEVSCLVLFVFHA